jgi:hypothetical protein
LGFFGSNAPNNFFDEQYKDDDIPISKFSASQGEDWIDHDCLEISYKNELKNLPLLVDGHSYSRDYINEVIKKAEILNINKANVFVLCDSNEINNPKPVIETEYQLYYLGKFKCNIQGQ